MSHPLSLSKKNTELWQQYQALKAKTPMLFPTEGAAALGTSEFELMLASPYSQYMGDQCKAVLKQFENLKEYVFPSSNANALLRASLPRVPAFAAFT